MLENPNLSGGSDQEYCETRLMDQAGAVQNLVSKLGVFCA